MGSFNGVGFLSHLPIRSHDEIAILICTVNKNMTEKGDYIRGLHYTASQLTPFCLPLYGKYYDYGYAEDIEDNYTARALSEFCGGIEIEKIVRALAMISDFTPTISMAKKRCYEASDKNIYGALKKLEYIYHNENGKLVKGSKEEWQFVVLMEHKSFFLECADKYHGNGSFSDAIDKNREIVKWFIDEYGKDVLVDRYGRNADFFDSMANTHFFMRGEQLFLEKALAETDADVNKVFEKSQANNKETFDNRNFIDMSRFFFNWHRVLPFYEHVECDFLSIEKEELLILRGLDYYMLMVHECLLCPTTWGQDDEMNDKREHYQRCIDFIDRYEREHYSVDEDEDDEVIAPDVDGYDYCGI